jgi:hypothetical protein
MMIQKKANKEARGHAMKTRRRIQMTANSGFFAMVRCV